MADSEKRRGSRLGYRVLGLFYKVFGYGFVAFWARMIVVYYFLFSKSAVESSIGFYAAMHPDASRKELKNMAWRQFKSFTTVFVDRFLIENGHHDRFQMTHDGLESITSAVEEGRGAILWMSHLGNWEVAVHCLKKCDVPVTLVIGHYPDERIEEFQREQLTLGRVKVITVKEDQDLGAVELIKAIKDGELVAISGDRLYSDRQRSVDVKLLGKSCRVPAGPYVLAGLTGASIIQIFGLRTSRLSYRFMALEPRKVQFGKRSERQAEIQRAAQGCFTGLEKVTTDFPEQWYNFFNYWNDPA